MKHFIIKLKGTNGMPENEFKAAKVDVSTSGVLTLTDEEQIVIAQFSMESVVGWWDKGFAVQP